MQQFDLSLWLQDKSRKVVTRDGREVDIYYSPTSRIPLIGRTSDNKIHQYTENGFQYEMMNQAKNALFFADEEEELTEFEKEVAEAYEWAKTTEREDFVNEFAHKLLDLARKKILKDLPKWKKGTPPSATTLYVIRKGYYLPIEEVDNLFEILPKE